MPGRKSQGGRGVPNYVAMRSLLVIADFALIIVALVIYAQSDIRRYAFYGTLCTVIVHLPILLGIVPALSMWGVLAFVVTIGAGVRGLAIGAGYPDENTLNYLFTRGVPVGDLVPEALLTVACVLLLTIGFSATVLRRRAGRGAVPSEAPAALTATSIPAPVFVTLIAAYALTGSVGTTLYYGAVGGAGASISGRRTTYTGSADYASHGKSLTGAGVVALLLFLAWRLAIRKAWTPVTWAALAVLSFNAFAINWVTTTRADLLYASFGVLLVVALVTGRLSSRLVRSVATSRRPRHRPPRLLRASLPEGLGLGLGMAVSSG